MTHETADDPIIYQVMILSGVHCIPLYPYTGKDKEIAIAIATAHIAKGDATTINEIKIDSTTETIRKVRNEYR